MNLGLGTRLGPATEEFRWESPDGAADVPATEEFRWEGPDGAADVPATEEFRWEGPDGAADVAASADELLDNADGKDVARNGFRARLREDWVADKRGGGHNCSDMCV